MRCIRRKPVSSGIFDTHTMIIVTTVDSLHLSRLCVAVLARRWAVAVAALDGAHAEDAGARAPTALYFVGRGCGGTLTKIIYISQ